MLCVDARLRRGGSGVRALGRMFAAAIVVSSLCFDAAAAEDAAPGAVVIAPGQDELLADMLGRGQTLAGECTLTNGLAESRMITATYACAAGEAVLLLRHPGAAPETATLTEQFAITVEQGSPPPSLVDAVAARIRARESGFDWMSPVYENVEPPADRLARDE